eukprot:TRINITY_DN1201_c0_g1_i2.p1 TRINITY_DN1201_c0_g1~~TRINITY_DN1201_c0_g1_i2.p1  ORF type:complete len:543 (-),score=130.59 TRINITY_DN1201_c0_g1_i2:83-1711(-)
MKLQFGRGFLPSDFNFELFLLHSPLLKESLLVSFSNSPSSSSNSSPHLSNSFGSNPISPSSSSSLSSFALCSSRTAMAQEMFQACMVDLSHTDIHSCEDYSLSLVITNLAHFASEIAEQKQLSFILLNWAMEILQRIKAFHSDAYVRALYNLTHLYQFCVQTGTASYWEDQERQIESEFWTTQLSRLFSSQYTIEDKLKNTQKEIDNVRSYSYFNCIQERIIPNSSLSRISYPYKRGYNSVDGGTIDAFNTFEATLESQFFEGLSLSYMQSLNASAMIVSNVLAALAIYKKRFINNNTININDPDQEKAQERGKQIMHQLIDAINRTQNELKSTTETSITPTVFYTCQLYLISLRAECYHVTGNITLALQEAETFLSIAKLSGAKYVIPGFPYGAELTCRLFLLANRHQQLREFLDILSSKIVGTSTRTYNLLLGVEEGLGIGNGVKKDWNGREANAVRSSTPTSSVACGVGRTVVRRSCGWKAVDRIRDKYESLLNEKETRERKKRRIEEVGKEEEEEAGGGNGGNELEEKLRELEKQLLL